MPARITWGPATMLARLLALLIGVGCALLPGTLAWANAPVEATASASAFARFALGPAGIVGAETPLPLLEQAAQSQCRVGRRFYCEKHLGVCRRQGGKTCEAWHAACFACHDDADACRRRLGKAGGLFLTCEKCRSAWSACMDRSYRVHWQRGRSGG
jgi:hypothetical protein